MNFVVEFFLTYCINICHVINQTCYIYLVSGQADVTVEETQIIEIYQKILWASQCSITTKEYALTSLMKLSARLNQEVG